MEKRERSEQGGIFAKEYTLFDTGAVRRAVTRLSQLSRFYSTSSFVSGQPSIEGFLICFILQSQVLATQGCSCIIRAVVLCDM